MTRTSLFRLALLCALLLPVFALAQTGTVRGFVYEESSGEPSILPVARHR